MAGGFVGSRKLERDGTASGIACHFNRRNEPKRVSKLRNLSLLCSTLRLGKSLNWYHVNQGMPLEMHEQTRNRTKLNRKL